MRGFPAVCLAIGVSDSSGGAGIQGDLKTFTALSSYGASVVTAVAAQSFGTLRDLHQVPEANVRAQLDAIGEDLMPTAVKVGLCPSVATMRVIARWLREHQGIPVVLDPVLASSQGIPLMTPEMVNVLKDELLPRATVATPNRFEAAQLVGMDECLTNEDMEHAARELLRRHGCPTLVTGGTHNGDSLDVLAALDGVRHFASPTFPRAKVHGAGSAHAAAIAANLSKGDSLREAVMAAKLFVSAAIAAAPVAASGRSALWHSVTVREQLIAPPIHGGHGLH